MYLLAFPPLLMQDPIHSTKAAHLDDNRSCAKVVKVVATYVLIRRTPGKTKTQRSVMAINR